jgi:hypothetical protein
LLDLLTECFEASCVVFEDLLVFFLENLTCDRLSLFSSPDPSAFSVNEDDFFVGGSFGTGENMSADISILFISVNESDNGILV